MFVSEYRKSSYSNEAAECVEVATNLPTLIAVRDSKSPTGPDLRLTPPTWTAFETALREGTL
ncbi:DUF397 domain-containing protein [Streptomyces acidiscabies]|uniref:DUF397 domain-containing protein n=1 Tax=Streptomyces acidiscabies TaxID=42234 RepID=A0AAP6B6X4_9ACTN|nr:DUF397 domain-containing protein [Streptomyces acidiscabies]MBP5939763.1 DUF397 domain-containing protein [Streptomyces sp. LBUM 1476]MBZ3910944.1 DUF397 domain-containing protein [Streptomyces acidiscabies]MDX2959276.1 DUF397 domain-containing protein [Streptomyces acidiscabies]MDX3017580.1 DUF397 domain-containing protein [Streptomyces acidiscabies]MDX3788055.1 DUF397 domain-containing protein [Streptomyces acidiscabies]